MLAKHCETLRILFIYLLTFSMLHYIVILHALGLSIHNMVTYIFKIYVQFLLFSVYTVKFTFGFLMYYLSLFNLLSTALLTK